MSCDVEIVGKAGGTYKEPAVERAVPDVWDTAYQPKAKRVEFFVDAVCRTYLHLTPTFPQDQPFEARITKVETDVGRVVTLRTTPHSVRRTVSDVSKLPVETVSVACTLSGSARFSTNSAKLVNVGRTAHLFYDNRPFEMGVSGDGRYSQIIVFFDADKLDKDIGIVQSFKESDTRSINDGVLRFAIMDALFTLRRYTFTMAGHEMSALSRAFALLTALHARGADSQLSNHVDERPIERRGFLNLIEEYLEGHLTDPNLTPTLVARRFAITPRYVHKLFGERNLTFGEFVRARRMEHIKLDLAQPALSNRSLEVIARRWGIPDVTNCHREFKEMFGLTPQEFRIVSKGKRS